MLSRSVQLHIKLWAAEFDGTYKERWMQSHPVNANIETILYCAIAKIQCHWLFAVRGQFAFRIAKKKRWHDDANATDIEIRPGDPAASA